ncbi:5-bromo-4-chloroindolyl phosphate hydrolysis family protein [uncultured Cohaesibacter sp.]|uniref:5-bromo-4-chloroindolyl phosphate hydrolysis family protein n=1 Tax=uncultured Cohaesibacter sp. TaxID=1002546 RepID=UPI0029C7516A|nr:5-bromo-4-chloroindolyl phosphate hydrolysis family protein [uncultured Cohaesibacter sp.]
MVASTLNNTRMMIAVIGAAVTALGLYFATQLHELIVLGVAVLVFGILHVIIPRAQEDSEVFVAPGVTRADLKAADAKGKEQIARLEVSVRQIPKADPAQHVLRSIEDIFRDIYANLDKDPGDIPRARAFLDFHSADAVSLIEGYAQLASSRLPDDKKLEQVEMARKRFASIEKAFRAQYNAMLANDVSALEQAGRNLESSLRLEHGLETMTLQPAEAEKS